MDSVCNELLFISPWKQNLCQHCLIVQGEHKVFPSLQTFITKNYVKYKHIFFPQNLTQLKNFDIWLAVHHSITFLLLPTWYTNFLFILINYIKLNSSTCFERNPPIIRRSTKQIVHIQHLVSSLSANDRLVQLSGCTRRSLAESDDTRGCMCTICVVDLLMIGGLRSKHVEEFNFM